MHNILYINRFDILSAQSSIYVSFCAPYMEGTELYDKMMEGSSEIAVRIKGLIEIRLKKPKKEFVVPDNIEEFDIRNYV